MFSKPSNPATELLKNVGLDQAKMVKLVQGRNTEEIIRSISQFKELHVLLIESAKVASRYRFTMVEVEHMLYVMSNDDRFVAYHALQELGIKPAAIVTRLKEWLTSISLMSSAPRMEEREDEPNGERMPNQGPFGMGGPQPGQQPDIFRYLTDLTELASLGLRDPVIGREREIDQMIEVLLRRQKNNPLLLGEAGVGKTALVDGLAQRIVAKKVPRPLIQKRVYLLDLSQVVAGTMYRGQFEERLKGILQAVREQGNIILFIDEIHTLTGAGSSEGGFDAANILKPALARGEISVIGATTHDEYRKFIMKDRALDRRFQVISVDEPSAVEAIKMLKGIRKELEQFHTVKISDAAIRSAVELSTRYIHDRFLPDKAIDVLDQACALHAEPYTGQTELEKLEHELEIVSQTKDEITLTAEVTDAQAWLRARELEQREIYLQKQIRLLEKQERKPKPGAEITARDISIIIAQRTGIPLSDIEQSLEPLDVKRIQTALRRHILGQDHAISQIAQTLLRSQLGLKPNKKPIGSFLLVGPTGVGKTETARILAKEIFGDSKALIKIDMSEFMERHTVSHLVGAPPGYVGFDQGGALTEQVRRRPYAVVLFDEVEKAHPDVFNILLQIMEDGVLTDNSGNHVSFEHALIIMTSNIGMDSFNTAARIGFQIEEGDLSKKEKIDQAELNNHIRREIDDFFRPELLGRMSGILFYQPLTKEVVRQLVVRHANDLKNHLQKRGISLTMPAAVIDWLVGKYNPEAGARSIDSIFREQVEPAVIQTLMEKGESKGIALSIHKDTVVSQATTLAPKEATVPVATAP
jgi:ATP-dependent Clp protease ATP-binding subunit ClpC